MVPLLLWSSAASFYFSGRIILIVLLSAGTSATWKSPKACLWEWHFSICTKSSLLCLSWSKEPLSHGSLPLFPSWDYHLTSWRHFGKLPWFWAAQPRRDWGDLEGNPPVTHQFPCPWGWGNMDVELAHCPHSRWDHCFPSPLLPSMGDVFRLLSSIPLMFFPIRSTVILRCTFTAMGKRKLPGLLWLLCRLCHLWIPEER